MQSKAARWGKWLLTTAICTSMLNSVGFVQAAGFDGSPPNKDAAAAFATESPIKHVIILIDENRGLDHTFGV